MNKSRQELFDLVWQYPMVHLAKQLNVSGPALKQTCKKNGIPLPAMGHWTRKRLGQEDQRPELPYVHHNPSIVFPDELGGELAEAAGVEHVNSVVPMLEQKPNARSMNQLLDLRCIRTAESIKAHIKSMEKKSTMSFDDFSKVKESWPPKTLFSFAYFKSVQDEMPIVATSKNAIRAVCIADEIIERLGRAGIEVTLEPKRNYIRYMMLAKKDGVEHEIFFRETWTKASKTTALNKLHKQLTGNDYWGSVMEVPKNILCIELGGRFGRVIRDGYTKLEDQTTKIVDHIIKKINERIEWLKECAIREREFERKKAIRDHNERIKVSMAKQLEIALKESEDHSQFRMLQDYLLVLDSELMGLTTHEREIGREWIALVKSIADAKNPLKKRLMAFSSIQQNGAANAGQHWHGKELPEDYDPEFEDELREDRFG